MYCIAQFYWQDCRCIYKRLLSGCPGGLVMCFIQLFYKNDSNSDDTSDNHEMVQQNRVGQLIISACGGSGRTLPQAIHEFITFSMFLSILGN